MAVICTDECPAEKGWHIETDFDGTEFVTVVCGIDMETKLSGSRCTHSRLDRLKYMKGSD